MTFYFFLFLCLDYSSRNTNHHTPPAAWRTRENEVGYTHDCNGAFHGSLSAACAFHLLSSLVPQLAIKNWRLALYDHVKALVMDQCHRTSQQNDSPPRLSSCRFRGVAPRQCFLHARSILQMIGPILLHALFWGRAIPKQSSNG